MTNINKYTMIASVMIRGVGIMVRRRVWKRRQRVHWVGAIQLVACEQVMRWRFDKVGLY